MSPARASRTPATPVISSASSPTRRASRSSARSRRVCAVMTLLGGASVRAAYGGLVEVVEHALGQVEALDAEYDIPIRGIQDQIVALAVRQKFHRITDFADHLPGDLVVQALHLAVRAPEVLDEPV